MESSRDQAAPLLRIGELSRRTGVSAEKLRAWERRYSLLEPRRTDGGFRLYGPEDEARVRAMTALIGSGISAAQAAEEARRAAPGPPTDGAPSAGSAGRLVAALERYDETAADAILDTAIASLSAPAFAASIALSAMEEIGRRWSEGKLTVAQEHFASNLIRGRLLGLARGWGGGSGPLALLACPPGELHDIGLISFGLALRAHGWRIAYLGPDTPVETLREAAGRLSPALVVIAALDPGRFAAVAGELSSLAGEHRLMLGGAGAAEAAAGRVGARLLDADPIEAARLAASAGS